MGDADGDTAAFDFETAVVPGKVDPDRQVLKIDYVGRAQPAVHHQADPRRARRDRAGANLGKILLRSRGGDHRLIGYFALKS